MNLHIPSADLVIPYSKSGEEEFIVAKWMVDNQLCWENLDKIKETFMLKMVIMEMMEEEKDTAALKDLASDVTLCEFMLQKLFKFPEDENYHRFWEYPQCDCPTMDNRERYPKGPYVVNRGCRIHGEE